MISTKGLNDGDVCIITFENKKKGKAKFINGVFKTEDNEVYGSSVLKWEKLLSNNIMTPQEQLRQLRNEILYDWKPPLEKGCEILFRDTVCTIISIHKNQFYGSKNLINFTGFNGDEDVTFNYDAGKIDTYLGKPVSLQDILRMINKIYTGFEIGITIDGRVIENHGAVSVFCSTDMRFNLSKEIESQENEEAVKQIINLLK